MIWKFCLKPPCWNIRQSPKFRTDWPADGKEQMKPGRREGWEQRKGARDVRVHRAFSARWGHSETRNQVLSRNKPHQTSRTWKSHVYDLGPSSLWCFCYGNSSPGSQEGCEGLGWGAWGRGSGGDQGDHLALNLPLTIPPPHTCASVSPSVKWKPCIT